MNLQRYQYKQAGSPSKYEFYSEGPVRHIQKIVEFQPLFSPGLPFYNLCFGDWNEKTQTIDDTAITNNGDAEKVLATVATIVVEFTCIFEQATVYAEGSNLARTRRYQIGINRFLNEIGEIFNVYGYVDECWEPFRKNINYQAFSIRRKKYLTLEEPNEPYMATSSDNNKKKTGEKIENWPYSNVCTADLSKDPVFAKKTEKARKFLEKHPLPKEFYPEGYQG